jgi:tetratricopeptide (TPR) repeat protein
MRAASHPAVWWRGLYIVVVIALCLFSLFANAQSAEDLPLITPLDAAVANLPLDPTTRTQIEKAVASRDYATAESILLRALDKAPSEPLLLSYAGRMFFMDHKYLNAAIAMKKADSQHRLNDPDRFTLAMTYIALQKPEWAGSELGRLEQSEPANPIYVYWQGRLAYDGQKMTEAADKFRQAIRLDPTFMKAYDNLGLCLDSLGKTDEALRVYEHAVTLNREPKLNSPWPPLNLGILLVRLNRLDEAGQLFREALQFNPSFSPAHYQLGSVLEKQGETSQAIEELKRASDLDPADPKSHYALARIYRRSNDERQAKQEIEAFESLRAKSPTD